MLSKAEAKRFPSDHGIFGTPGDVSPWDIRFDPSDRAYLDSDSAGHARIRVWTEPGLTDGHLVVRTDERVFGYEMGPVDGMRFTFWEVVAGPFDDKTEFTFAFKSPAGHGVYFVEGGVTNAVERIDRWTMSLPPPLGLPTWGEGMVIYQIFPDRFSSGGTNGDPTERWGAEPTPTGFQGGDLDGITDRLGYLSDLGVDALYLNPVFVSPSNHRYDTIDYYNVDPRLGGNEALDRLVDKAHGSGLKVFLDASFNHVHPRFFAFRDVAENGPKSEYWSWFVVEEWPLRIGLRSHLLTPGLVAEIEEWSTEMGVALDELEGEGPPTEPTYEAWYGVATMPRVDLADPGARNYMLGVGAHWVDKYGVDGWRMDVARYVDPDFWDDFRSVVRAVRSDVYLLCEVMGDASDWLQGDRFDATMNYTFRDLCLRFFGPDEEPAERFLDDATRLWAQYPWRVTLANHNLLGSHDTPRILTELGGEQWRMMLAAVFQMTFPGAPGIYYGDEMGMEGGDDPYCRGAFLWDQPEPEPPIRTTYRELAELRSQEPALTVGEWQPMRSQGGLAVYGRQHGHRCVVVAINREEKAVRVESVEVDEVLWGEATVERRVGEVAARSAAIFSVLSRPNGPPSNGVPDGASR